MNLKTRLKSVSFWTTLAGAILMILRAFGIEMGGTEIETAISSIGSILVFSGILIGDKNTSSATASNTETVADGIEDTGEDADKETEVCGELSQQSEAQSIESADDINTSKSVDGDKPVETDTSADL